MDFHETSLRAYEAQQRLEDAQPVPIVETTFYIMTSDWEEWAINQDELKALTDDAILDGLAYTIKTCNGFG